MFVSEKRLNANRLNAQKSTGPRSAEGKDKVSQNALTHGLTSEKHTVLPGEDASEFEALRRQFIRDLKPIGIMEETLVDQAASIAWKLKRIPAIEAAWAEQQNWRSQKYG